MSSFKNKVVWITGASSGIGEALAHAFALQGAKLILSARREEELQRVKTAIKLPEADVLLLPLDLGDTANIDKLTQKAISTFGRIDLLINNGGISQRSLVKNTSPEIDRKLMEVNFFGTVAITKSVLPSMIKSQSGHIVVISSIAGKFGFYLRSSYAASKHALHGFFESLRMEIHSDNVKVLIVCPGKIKTNISLNALTGDGNTHKRMDASTEKGMSAEECANKILLAISKNKEEVFIGGKELNAVWVKRFFPAFFSRMIRKQKPE
ncbi:MAG: SDR family oxidoreductase [Bacteroidota bacterium]|nr:SDR family oxidoreductase [Bacteroidota bacterium]